MKTIKLPYGITYLFDDPNEELRFENDENIYFSDENGQWSVVYKNSNKEVDLVPRTNGLAHCVIESHIPNNAAIEFGKEIHNETELGKRNAYNRPLNLEKAVYKEIPFLCFAEFGVFSGKIDLVYPEKKSLSGLSPSDLKTGNLYITSLRKQLLNYAFALGSETASGFLYSKDLGNYSITFYYLSETYYKVKEMYEKWMIKYQEYKTFENKEHIDCYENTPSENPVIEDAKGFLKIKSIEKLVKDRIKDWEEKKVSISNFLGNRKLNMYLEDEEKPSSLAVASNGALRTNNLYEPSLSDIQSLIVKNTMDNDLSEVL